MTSARRNPETPMPPEGAVIPWPVLDAAAIDARELACSVVQRAIDDALTARITPTSSADAPSRSEHAEAVLFCTSDVPEWREARQAWCDAAGIVADRLRDMVKARLETLT